MPDNKEDATTSGCFVRFSLLTFSKEDPEVWISAAEHIFQSNRVNTLTETFINFFVSVEEAKFIGPFRQQPTFGKIKFSLWHLFVLRLCRFVLKIFSFVLN